jgi:hypothetical protein
VLLVASKKVGLDGSVEARNCLLMCGEEHEEYDQNTKAVNSYFSSVI